MQLLHCVARRHCNNQHALLKAKAQTQPPCTQTLEDGMLEMKMHTHAHRHHACTATPCAVTHVSYSLRKGNKRLSCRSSPKMSFVCLAAFTFSTIFRLRRLFLLSLLWNNLLLLSPISCFHFPYNSCSSILTWPRQRKWCCCCALLHATYTAYARMLLCAYLLLVRLSYCCWLLKGMALLLQYASATGKLCLLMASLEVARLCAGHCNTIRRSAQVVCPECMSRSKAYSYIVCTRKYFQSVCVCVCR